MRISQIELRNFRGIRHGRITLPAHAVLLGANNSGKDPAATAQLTFGQFAVQLQYGRSERSDVGRPSGVVSGAGGYVTPSRLEPSRSTR